MLKNLSKLQSLITIALLATACGEQPITGTEPSPPTPVPPPPTPSTYLLGSLVGIEQHIRWGDVKPESQKDEKNTTRYNYPLFVSDKPTQEARSDEWWDNLVEEIAHSGMDYAMINTRGLAPNPEKYNDHGDPRRVAEFVKAMERRGVADKFKVAIFDDCPASWAASRNMDIHGEYSSNLKFPYPLDQLFDNPETKEKGIYPYIWDQNIKIAFKHLPDEYRFKIDGRPVIYLWSPNSFVEHDGSAKGKLSPILKQLRKDFKEEFGVDPLIVTDHAFQHRDVTVGYPIVDGLNGWFGMEPDKQWTNMRMKGKSFGVAVPGFSIDDLPTAIDESGKRKPHMFIDADHGKRLISSLQNLGRVKSDVVLVEGFTDVYENAALWRSTDTKFYDYPNQRLNILRRFNRDPDVVWPKDRRIEAEGCDYFNDNTPENSGKAYRRGDIDVVACSDTWLGWQVTDAEAGEWLRWMELPFRAATTKFTIRYSSKAAAEVCFSVDEKDCPRVTLPSTEGEWKSHDAGTVTLSEYGLHTLTLKITAGTIEINYFNMTADR